MALTIVGTIIDPLSAVAEAYVQCGDNVGL